MTAELSTVELCDPGQAEPATLAKNTARRGNAQRSVTIEGRCAFSPSFPFLGILVGTPLLNRVEPTVFGFPLILAWLVFWVVATAVIMALVYRTDPTNRLPDEGTR